MKNVKKNAIRFKLFWDKIFVHGKSKLPRFPGGFRLNSLVKVLLLHLLSVTTADALFMYKENNVFIFLFFCCRWFVKSSNKITVINRKTFSVDKSHNIMISWCRSSVHDIEKNTRSKQTVFKNDVFTGKPGSLKVLLFILYFAPDR